MAQSQSLDDSVFVNQSEQRLKRALKGVRLVCELDLEGEDYAAAAAAMRLLVRRYDNERLASMYPAITVFFLVAEGVHRYDGGAYWPELSVPSIDQTVMGPAFVGALKSLRLPAYEEETRGGPLYVAKILFHGGIPRYCAKDVLRLLASESRHGAADGRDVITSWRRASTRLESVDKPARRFLLQGQEEAVDLIDRVLDMMRASAEGATLDPSVLGVPAYIIEEYQQLTAGDRRLGTSVRPPRPVVEIDLYSGDGPELVLPIAGDVWRRWSVRAGGVTRSFETSRVRPQRLPLDPEVRWDVELAGAARRVLYELRGCERAPALFFDPSSGVLLRDQDRLRGDAVVALLPQGVNVRVGSSSGEPVTDLYELPPLHGAWSRHVLRLLDLGAVDRVWIGTAEPLPGLPFADAELTVAASAPRPVLVAQMVPGVMGSKGEPVALAWPTVEVPPDFEADARWHYRATVNGREFAGRLADLRMSGRQVMLSSIAEDLPLAEVTVNVLGPLGSDLRDQSFVVVADLEVGIPGRAVPARSEVSVAVSVGGELTAGGDRDTVVRIAGGAQSESLLVASSTHSATLTVEVPRFMWSVRRRGVTAPYDTDPVSVGLDEVSSGGVDALLIRTGVPAKVVLSLTTAHEVVATELPVKTLGGDGRWVFSLGPIIDTARQSGSARLELAALVDDAFVEVVAHLHARHEVSGLAIESLVDNDENRTLLAVSWSENRAFVDRELRLWPRRRPWEGPVTLRIPDTADGSYEVLVDRSVPAGDYVAEIAIADGWVVPRRPVRGRTDLVTARIGTVADQEGRLRSLSGDDPRQHLELVLAGRSPVSPLDLHDHQDVVADVMVALLELARTTAWRQLDDPDLRRLREALFQDPDVIPGGIDDLVASGRLDHNDLLRLSILVLTDALDCGLDYASDRVRERLLRDAPVLGAALDSWPLDEAGCERWRSYLGWAPNDSSELPHHGGGLESFMLCWTADRIDSLLDVVDPSERGALSHAGFVRALLSWLRVAGFPDPKSTALWRTAHGVLNDRRARQTEDHDSYLDALKSGLNVPPAGRLPADIQAAAFHATAFGHNNGRAERALLEGVDNAPELVERALLVAIVLHKRASL